MTDAPAPEEAVKLPLWRLIAALCVLAGMAVILLTLAPVYFEDFQMRQYIRSLARGANAPAMADQSIRSAVIARARQLDLPIQPEEVLISRANGKLQVQMKYAVQMDFPLYQVDLHFHPSVTGP